MINIISDSFSGSEAKRLLFQFRDFMWHGGLLPSCSICLHSNNQMDRPPKERILKDIGNFDFYFFEEKYYIGYHYFENCYALLKAEKDFSEMDVYYQELGFDLHRSDIANLIYIAYRYRALEFKAMMIHAAAIVYNKEAILFCGRSGAGKSTQANLWKQYLDSDVLNYDKPCIIPVDDNWIAHGTPWSGKEGVYKNHYVPLKAIVFVQQDNNNQVIQLSSGEAFTLLYLNNYLYPLNEDMELKYYSVVAKIAQEVSFFKLKCTKDRKAVQVLYKEIYGIDCLMEG